MKKTVADEVERVKSASGKVIDEKKTKKSKTDVKRHEFDQLVSLKDIATLEKYPSPVKVLHRLRVRISIPCEILRNFSLCLLNEI